MKGIWFDPRAEEEFLLSAKYYEKQESGLGFRFMLAVEVALKYVLASPQMHRKIYGDCRKCRVVRFPYALLFRRRGGALVIGLRNDPYFKVLFYINESPNIFFSYSNFKS